MHNDSFGLALEERHTLFAVLFLNAGACFTKQYFCKTNLYSRHSTVKANQRERSGGMPILLLYTMTAVPLNSNTGLQIARISAATRFGVCPGIRYSIWTTA